MASTKEINGTNNDDILIGNQGNDAISGDAGNDIISGNAGDDTIVTDHAKLIH
ncbi:hypothetical protein QE197_16720 [Arsenophonus nasoniae]|uniref:Hemolysin-type calcium-binding repeat (2 copies) n=1 Tax=Arsenophonus nasoniae TaxID=638 RepID=D2TWM0_9GAMM|nr:hypothetical protein [Arsenophonus nasoniae]QBY45203.1 hemolysin-type calcium-binding repeat (2 copies) [Arsenophonus nasoniae]WGM05390.1 hypothetical protein QE258_18095 [Arsenophonus nasoniae]WGM10398.1 hypothetical protein QE197_16720 [Arsenophonus nasoniae]WGM15110.1 hypothetical protein QE193_16610 [Arsenophonus nasoniae]CBA71775.1 hypothetical protein ARN_04540 [Arsenophonus nasoniae]